MELPRRLPPRRPAKNSRSGSSGSKRRGVPHLGAPDGGSGTALVVGLGNPGRKYRNTRHNLGRMAAEAVADRSEVLSQGRWPQGRLALVSAGGRRFLILAPETFMNVSGCAVARVVERYGLKPEQVLVLHDDIDLPLGDVRVKKGGGTGGHRGLASLVQELDESGFSRVRIGVGRPPEGVDAADYVLSPLPDADRDRAMRAVEEAAEAALSEVTGAGRAG